MAIRLLDLHRRLPLRHEALAQRAQVLRVAAPREHRHAPSGEVVRRGDARDVLVGDEQLVDAILLAAHERDLRLALRRDRQVRDRDVAAPVQQCRDEILERDDDVLDGHPQLALADALVQRLAILLHQLDQDAARARALEEEVGAARRHQGAQDAALADLRQVAGERLADHRRDDERGLARGGAVGLRRVQRAGAEQAQAGCERDDDLHGPTPRGHVTAARSAASGRGVIRASSMR